MCYIVTYSCLGHLEMHPPHLDRWALAEPLFASCDLEISLLCTLRYACNVQ